MNESFLSFLEFEQVLNAMEKDQEQRQEHERGRKLDHEMKRYWRDKSKSPVRSRSASPVRVDIQRPGKRVNERRAGRARGADKCPKLYCVGCNPANYDGRLPALHPRDVRRCCPLKCNAILCDACYVEYGYCPPCHNANRRKLEVPPAPRSSKGATSKNPTKDRVMSCAASSPNFSPPPRRGKALPAYSFDDYGRRQPKEPKFRKGKEPARCEPQSSMPDRPLLRSPNRPVEFSSDLATDIPGMRLQCAKQMLQFMEETKGIPFVVAARDPRRVAR